MYALPQRRKKENLNEVTQHYENMAKQKEHPFGVRAYVLAYHFIPYNVTLLTAGVC